MTKLEKFASVLGVALVVGGTYFAAPNPPSLLPKEAAVTPRVFDRSEFERLAMGRSGPELVGQLGAPNEMRDTKIWVEWVYLSRTRVADSQFPDAEAVVRFRRGGGVSEAVIFQ